MTSADFATMELRNAIRDIDNFAGRYRGLPGIAEFALPLRERLMKQLKGAETVQIDIARRKRQAPLKTVETVPTTADWDAYRRDLEARILPA